MDINDAFAPIVESGVEEIASFLTQIAQHERMEDSTEYMDNPEESAQMEEEIKATYVKGEADGMTAKFSLVTSGSEYDKVTTEGKPESYSGGQEGMVTLVTGEEVPSKVNPNLWGQPVPDSAEPPSVWKDNYEKIAGSLASQQMSDYIREHASKALTPVIANAIQSRLGGDL